MKHDQSLWRSLVQTELEKNWQGELKWDESLSRHTSWNVGGPADLVCVPSGKNDLEVLSGLIRRFQVPFAIIGMGSNLLVPDEGFRGIVIKTSRLNLELRDISDQPARLHVGASVPLRMLLSRCVREGWGGLEFLSGIPGSCGGAAVMNAGTHLGESSGNILQLETFDILEKDPLTAWKQWGKTELHYEYRKNKFLNSSMVVWAVDWSFEPKSSEVIETLVQETLKRRKDSQPIDLPSCGSVFKNPPSPFPKAWQVIDQLGLRGHVQGGAQISPKHSNFIVNNGGAKATDIVQLIELIQTRAKRELGIEMVPEVKVLRPHVG